MTWSQENTRRMQENFQGIDKSSQLYLYSTKSQVCAGEDTKRPAVTLKEVQESAAERRKLQLYGSLTKTKPRFKE